MPYNTETSKHLYNINISNLLRLYGMKEISSFFFTNIPSPLCYLFLINVDVLYVNLYKHLQHFYGIKQYANSTVRCYTKKHNIT